MNIRSSSTLKNIGIGAVSLIIIAGAYIFLVSKNDAGQALLTKDASSSSAPANPLSGNYGSPVAEAQDVVLILNQLKSVSIDETIFTDPAFMTLTDFHRDIAPQPKGRSNPFAPGEGVKTASPGASTGGLR